MTEITTTDSTVDLNEIVYIASEKDDEGNIISEQQVDTKDIKWYSTVEGIATVTEDGVVTRQQYGDVKIYAVPLDGSTNYGVCTIHFQENNATDVVINKDTLDLQIGYRAYADYIVLPETASNDLEWISLNEDIATVTQSGLIEAKALGNTKIICKTKDGSGITREITVNVTEITVKRITLSKSYVEASYSDIGKTYQLSVLQYYPSTAVNQKVGKWESTDENIVTVDQNGLVRVTGNGVAAIKAYSTDGQCYGSCTFYIQPPAVKNLTVSAAKNSVSLQWEAVDNCYGYYVYMLDKETGEYKVLNNGNYITYTDFVVSDLEPDTEYTFCVKAFISRWSSSSRYLIESEAAVIQTSTYSYVPISSYFSLPNPVEILYISGSKCDGWFQCNPSDADYPDLEVYCVTEDESIAKVTSVTKSPDGVNRYNYTIEGVSQGITKLIISSNDGKGVSYEVPVGVLSKECKLDYSTLSAETEYRHLTLTFTGLEDETNIDGYMVRKTKTVMFNDVEYIPKQGNHTVYTFEETDGMKDGESFRYTVVPVLKDGDTFFRAYASEWVTVTFPEAVLITDISTAKELYNIPMDTTGSISASFSPANADYNELIYTIMDSKTAYAERTTVTGSTNYGIITPKRAGVTQLEIAASDFSNVKKYVDIIISPSKPEALVVIPMTKAAALSWEKTEGADGYFIYRYNDTTGKWDKIADVKNNQYADTGLENDKTYRYKIAGYITYNNNKYRGSLSDAVTARTFLGKFDISISGYNGVYDGNYHEAVILNSQPDQGDTLTYSLDFTNWTSSVPKIKNVSDSTAVYIQEQKSDGSKYMTVVAAKISKAPVTPNMPDTALSIPNNKSMVKDAVLPSDWKWQIGEGELVIEPGESVIAAAVYNGADKGNYKTEILSITVSREACSHLEMNRINERKATCETDGYTGDYQCRECGEIIITGTIEPAAGHDWSSGCILEQTSPDQEGIMEYICNVCGAVRYETINPVETTSEDYSGTTGDASGETSENDNTVTNDTEKDTDMDITEASAEETVKKNNRKDNQESPVTGDKIRNFNIILILFISFTVVIVVCVNGKKKENEKREF